MGLLETIVGGGVGQLVKTVFGTFKLSPEAKAEIDKQLEDHKFELEKLDRQYESKLLDAQTKEIEAAGANISAEAQSGDKFTSRARPTFLYICYVILINNYMLVPWFNRQSVDFPEPLFWLMGTVMTGYVASRGWEKVMGMRGKG